MTTAKLALPVHNAINCPSNLLFFNYPEDWGSKFLPSIGKNYQ